jgi:hypothetical protein
MKYTREQIKFVNSLLSDGGDDFESHEDNKHKLASLLSERTQLTDKFCEVEKFLDRKKKHTLISTQEILQGRKFYSATSGTIKKQGYGKITSTMNVKPKSFLDGIHKLMAEQNLKVEFGIYYDYELLFFKSGAKKNPDDIIVRIIKTTESKAESLIWVGLVNGKYYIIHD